MKQLFHWSANYFLMPTGLDQGPFKPMVEAIFSATEPRYVADEAGQPVRTGVVETVRFCSTPATFRELAALLLMAAEKADLMAEELVERHEAGLGDRAAEKPKKPAAKAAKPKPDAPPLPGTD